MSQSARPASPNAASFGKARSGSRSAQNQQFLTFYLANWARGAGLSLPGVALYVVSALGAFAVLSPLFTDTLRGTVICVSIAVIATAMLLGLRIARRAAARTRATVALLKALLDANRECLKLLDSDGRMVRISEYGAKLMEAARPEDLQGADWLGFWSGDEASAAREALQGALSGSRTAFTGACPTTTGVPKVWQSRLIPIDDCEGGVRGVLCASLDVTKEAELAADLRAKQALMSEMEAHIDLCFYSYSADLSYFHHVSAGCASVFGLEAASLRKRPEAWIELIVPEDRVKVQAAMGHIAEASVGGRTRYRIRKPDGHVRWIQSTGYPVLDERGNVARIVGISEDITAEHERLAELDRLAFSDSLTGLPNRGALVRKIEERCTESDGFALMFIDLDRFKVLNDTLGHTAADRLLRSLGETIKAELPSDAFLARLGGDEFAVLVNHAEDKASLADIARNILGALSKTGQTPGTRAFVTASIGISMYPEHGGDHETLLTSADIAMYAAKKAGRNGFRFADQDAAERIVDFELERDLPAALANNQFVLHYQAIHEPHTLDVRSVEALIRWRHPSRGLVSPGVFIPILEESGFIKEVGAWVLDDALRQLAHWRRDGAHALDVSVNVSARQLRDSDIVEMVAEALRRHQLPACSLQLELTESALMENPTVAQRTLSALKDLGVRIAIDDFGTGYSSLRYLADFAPDTLKIDRSFVARLQDDDATRNIVSGIIRMSHTLGVKVAGEGVEEPAQLELLREAQCDFVQGFLLSRPVAPERVMGLSPVARA